MKNWKCATRWVGITGVVMLLAACGGGGGSGGGSGSGGGTGVPGASSGPASGVTVGAPTPTSIAYVTVPNQQMANITLSGTVSGDLKSLDGKPLYVVVEDPDQLFRPDGASVGLDASATSGTYRLQLTGAIMTRSGQLKGNLRIFACLDARCAQPLGGTPLIVPYDVSVEGGIKLSRTEVNVKVPFGTVPATESVEITLPGHSTGWSAVTGQRGFGSPFYLPQGDGVLVPGNILQIAFRPDKPGSYSLSIPVMTTIKGEGTKTFPVQNSITVNYTVEPNPALDYVFYPSPHDISVKRQAGDAERPYRLITNTGVTAYYAGVEYLSAAGSTGPAQWWTERGMPSVSTCWGNDVVAGECLTPGLYTARVRHVLTTPSGQRDVYLPINLTVTP